MSKISNFQTEDFSVFKLKLKREDFITGRLLHWSFYDASNNFDITSGSLLINLESHRHQIGGNGDALRINLIKDDKLEAIMEDLFNEDDEDEDIEMSIDDFEVLGLIGRGSFGKILLAIDSEDRKVALKVLKKSTVLMTEDGVEDIFKEKRILQLQNRFKSTAYYTFQDADFLYMGMKYIAAGDLFSNMSAGTFFIVIKSSDWLTNEIIF